MSAIDNSASSMKVDRSRLVRVAVPALGLFWLAVTTLPFLFVVMTSLKSQQETFSGAVWALPESLNFANYLDVLNGGFWVYLRNSVFVLVLSIGLILVISSMAAYAFARLRFRLNKPLFGLIVAGMIVPIHITLIPIYLLIRNVGLYDTPFALIGPYVATALPVSIFILTEFMRQIPRSWRRRPSSTAAAPSASSGRFSCRSPARACRRWRSTTASACGMNSSSPTC